MTPGVEASLQRLARRMACCRACPTYDPGARDGLGKCLKFCCQTWPPLAAEAACPEGRWGREAEADVPRGTIF